MFIKETPHINLRKIERNSYNIDYTSAHITQHDDNTAAAYSYYTLLGLYIRDIKTYFKNYYSYSTTTATKHHPRAARIAIANGYNIVEVHPDVLKKILYAGTPGQEVLNDLEKHNAIKEKILNGENIEAEKVTRLIKPAGNPTRKDFKKSYHTIYYYTLETKFFKTNFKVKTIWKEYSTRTRTGPAKYYKEVKRSVIFS